MVRGPDTASPRASEPWLAGKLGKTGSVEIFQMTKKALILAAGILLLAPVGVRPAYAARVVDQIIARVNNEIITQIQFQNEKDKLRAQLAQQYSGPELETAYKEQSQNLLRDMIDQDLMVQKAKDLDISVDTDLAKRLDDIRKSMGLATTEDLQNAVEKQGLVWEDFQDNIKRNLLMREVINREVGSRVIISKDEAEKFYEAHKENYTFPEGVHLAEILISTEKHKPDEAKALADKALAEINAGNRWEDVAKKYSDADTAEQGGDIGFFKKGTLAPDLDAAIAKLDDGGNTGIINTKYGYVILKLIARRKQGVANFVDVEQRVDEDLYNQKLQPALRDYLTTLRSQSYIFLEPGYVDTGAQRPSERGLPSGQ